MAPVLQKFTKGNEYTTINLFQQVRVNNVHFTPKHELWILNDIFLNQIYNNVNNYLTSMRKTLHKVNFDNKNTPLNTINKHIT